MPVPAFFHITGSATVGAVLTEVAKYIGLNTVAAVGFGVGGAAGGWWWFNRETPNEEQEKSIPKAAAKSQEKWSSEHAEAVKSGLKACETNTKKTADKVASAADALGEAVDEMRNANMQMASTGEAIHRLNSTLEESSASMTNAAPELKAGAEEVERVANKVIASLRELKEEDQKKVDNAVSQVRRLAQTFQHSLRGFMGKFQDVIAQNISLQAAAVVNAKICMKQDETFQGLQVEADKTVDLLEKIAEAEVLRRTTPKATSPKETRIPHSKSSPLHSSGKDSIRASSKISSTSNEVQGSSISTMNNT